MTTALESTPTGADWANLLRCRPAHGPPRHSTRRPTTVAAEIGPVRLHAYDWANLRTRPCGGLVARSRWPSHKRNAAKIGTVLAGTQICGWTRQITLKMRAVHCSLTPKFPNVPNLPVAGWWFFGIFDACVWVKWLRSPTSPRLSSSRAVCY